MRLGLLLRDLNEIISPPESEDEDEDDNHDVQDDDDDDDDDIANSNNSHQLPARKKKRQSTSPRSELLTQQFEDDGPYGFVENNNEVEDFIESMCDDANQEGKKPYLEEKEEQAPPPPPAFLSEDPFARVLSETAAMVTNAHPPATFSVSRRDNELRLDNRERERIRRLRLREAKQAQDQRRRRQMEAASNSFDAYKGANDGTAKISGDDRSDQSASFSFASCCSEEYLSEDEDDLETDDDSEEEQPAPTIRMVRRGPPLFDGSVANATPGNGGDGGAAQQQQVQVQADAQGQQQDQQEAQQPQPQAQPQMGGGDQGGGAGTILHLACAIDSPFALAILLVLGGDVLTRHTAFRRLVVHEAASAGSPECLRLLLEFSDLYRAISDSRMKARINRALVHVGANSMSDPSSNPGISTNMPPTISAGGSLLQHLHQHQQQRREQQERLSSGPRSLFLPPRPDDATPPSELGEFPSWNGQDGTNALPPVQPLSPPLTKASPRSRSSRIPIKTPRRMSFVDTLRLISDLSEQIKDGITTDLAAGRLLMSRAGVPNITKSGLISFSPLLGHAPSFTGVRSSIDVLAFPHPSFATWHHIRRDADGHGNGPLHWASFKNNALCVSVLLEHNANPNARAEPSGWTPLHDAAYSDASDCVDLLIKAGADFDARANSGATPLCFAAQEDAPGAAKLLLEAGADPAVRCAHNTAAASNNAQQQQQPQPSRFSG